MLSDIKFTLPEILSLIGLVQCLYLVFHMFLRKGLSSVTLLPMAYFASLAAAFFLDAAQSRLFDDIRPYPYLQWFFWFIGPPLSVLVIQQIADMRKMPPIKEFWILLLLPLSFMLSHIAVGRTMGCTFISECEALEDIMNVTGLMSCTISLLIIFSQQKLFKTMRRQRFGSERYWLAMSLIFLNSLFICVVFLNVNGQIDTEQTGVIKTILGIGFVYLVSTSLFRIFPQETKTASKDVTDALSEDDEKILDQIEELLSREKVYQEPAYSRTDIAQECNTSEATISRLVNVKYNKSLPQIMNEYRIEDAKRLLRETNAAVKLIASEVGFNSLPSFNRAFKDIVEISPSNYRKKHLKM